MRLIDADKLIDYFYFGIDDKPIIDGISDRKIIDIIKNQPSAYDIDKVVSEIRRTSGNGYRDIDGDYVPPMIKTDKAIEIVKQGGVSDDVCELKSDYGFISDKYKRETQCGYTFYDLHHAVAFKYCPYCGKKIKVVE